MKPLWCPPFVGLPYTAGVFCSVTKLAHDPAVLTLALPQLGGGGEGRDAAPSKGVTGTFKHSPPCPVGWSLATWPHLAGRRLENVLFIFHLQFMKQSLKKSSKKKKKLFQIYLTSVSLELEFLKVSMRVTFELSMELSFLIIIWVIAVNHHNHHGHCSV